MKFVVSLLLLINLNTATVEELDTLPGVGPVIARRIVEFRERRGGFRRVEELLAIQGISEQRWQQIRKLVEVRDVGELLVAAAAGSSAREDALAQGKTRKERVDGTIGRRHGAVYERVHPAVVTVRRRGR